MESLIKTPVTTGIRRLFYVVSPNESSFETVEEVPQYVTQAIPFFILCILVELVIIQLNISKRPLMKYTAMDTVSSLCAGIFSIVPLVVLRGLDLTTYMYVHEHFRLGELPWDHPLTWIACMVGVDHMYYWVHRMAHEVNFMWAGHQVHHSSEYFNLSTALRQSVVQKYTSWIFYLPLALFIPPSIFLVHVQFNLIYQFWVHTELVGDLGILEYIIVTPSQHRVHHGRNRYCIDKNYGGFLSIWDRLYGTFELEADRVQYGLVHPLCSWDNLYTQFCHWCYMVKTALTSNSLMEAIYRLIWGPGWYPGTARLGNPEDIPDIKAPLEVYDKHLSWSDTVYTYVHLALTVLSYAKLEDRKPFLDSPTAWGGVLYLVWSLASIGYISEKKCYRWQVELARCTAYICADLCTSGAVSVYLPHGYALALYAVSAAKCVASML